MLHPAGLRIYLREFLLRHADVRPAVIEHDGARAGGALVEREYIARGGMGFGRGGNSASQGAVHDGTGDSADDRGDDRDRGVAPI